MPLDRCRTFDVIGDLSWDIFWNSSAPTLFKIEILNVCSNTKAWLSSQLRHFPTKVADRYVVLRLRGCSTPY